MLRRVELEIETEVEASPASVSLRTGQAAQAVDPNLAHCSIVWNSEGAKDLECLAPDNAGLTVRPDEYFGWNTWSVGRYIYFEATITGTGGVASITGGTLWLTGRERNIRG